MTRRDALQSLALVSLSLFVAPVMGQEEKPKTRLLPCSNSKTGAVEMVEVPADFDPFAPYPDAHPMGCSCKDCQIVRERAAMLRRDLDRMRELEDGQYPYHSDLGHIPVEGVRTLSDEECPPLTAELVAAMRDESIVAVVYPFPIRGVYYEWSGLHWWECRSTIGVTPANLRSFYWDVPEGVIEQQVSGHEAIMAQITRFKNKYPRPTSFTALAQEGIE